MWGVGLYDHVLSAELAKQSKLILSDLRHSTIDTNGETL